MKDILSEIAANKRRELSAVYRDSSRRDSLYRLVEQETRTPRSMKKAIMERNVFDKPGIIAEFKRRSPSKGEICGNADVASVERIYQEGGAAASSVLTDTRYFGGALTDLSVARDTVELPLLRKDFIIDEIQIAEAYVAGADAILLIATLLGSKEIKDFTAKAHALGMEILFEVHGQDEIKKVPEDADLIGVNNRALSSFATDVNHSAKMIDFLSKDKVLVAESGIKTEEDVRRLMDCGYNAFLIGETFMKATDPLATLRRFAYVD